MMTSLPQELQPLADYIEKTDDDGVVQIYSYKVCSIDSPPELKQCRGLVYAGSQRVLRSFGFNPEYNDTQISDISQSTSEYTFYPSEEGTLIRVFWVEQNNKWYVATHRKLDAFKSKWGSSKSFGEMFVDALQEIWPETERDALITRLTAKLSQTSAYFFLLRNTNENRIVCHAPEKSTIYHIGTLKSDDLFDLSDVIDDQIPKQVPLSFDSWQDVTTYVSQVDPLKLQGVIGFSKTGAEIKVINLKNQQYAAVRGNDSNLLMRYLKVRNNASSVNMLFEVYPDQVAFLQAKETLLTKLAMYIHTAYLNRYVSKMYVVVPKEEYRIMSECHAHYLSDRSKNHVTLAVVQQVMARESMVHVLFTILKRPSPEQNE